jgi:hypothetical protein
MTEEASSDDYSGSSGYRPHRRRQPGQVFQGQIVRAWGVDIRLAQCTTLWLREQPYSLKRDLCLDTLWEPVRPAARRLGTGMAGVVTYAAAPPTRRLHVGKKWWKGRDSNPRPRHYEECGRPDNPLSSITYTGSGRSRRKIRHCWKRQIPAKSARNPPRSTNPKNSDSRERQ